ncbi:hypothetical protein [Trinickia acidisoli]|uniref:hypothetical protein n=1 Tax=Trinickia acidisoli TaxID=2767482 RepID=UPI001A8FE4FA|nr:hypothetical protein [Trinickia acidisoli]
MSDQPVLSKKALCDRVFWEVVTPRIAHSFVDESCWVCLSREDVFDAKPQLARCRPRRYLRILGRWLMRAARSTSQKMLRKSAPQIGSLAHVQAGVRGVSRPPVAIMHIDAYTARPFQNDVPISLHQLCPAPNPPKSVHAGARWHTDGTS